jgi:hypothetical protein
MAIYVPSSACSAKYITTIKAYDRSGQSSGTTSLEMTVMGPPDVRNNHMYNGKLDAAVRVICVVNHNSSVVQFQLEEWEPLKACEVIARQWRCSKILHPKTVESTMQLDKPWLSAWRMHVRHYCRIITKCSIRLR